MRRRKGDGRAENRHKHKEEVRYLKEVKQRGKEGRQEGGGMEGGIG